MTNQTEAERRATAYLDKLPADKLRSLMDAHRAKQVEREKAEQAAQPLYNLVGMDARERLWPSKPKR